MKLREWIAFGIVAVGGAVLIAADRAIVKARDAAVKQATIN